jgi:PTS system cellobiose-specific IIC component
MNTPPAPPAGFLQRRLLPFLNAVSEDTTMSAIRAGMVSVVPLTILGGLFMILANLPIAGWEQRIAKWAPLLQIPVSATFGLLGVFVCFAIGYDLGQRLKQEAIVSASLSTLVFLLIQIDPATQSLVMDNLGSKGLFPAILVAAVCVRVQKLFHDWNVVIRLPKSVPTIVYESFASLTPTIFLVVAFWVVRFVLGVDINAGVQAVFKPLVVGLNTLPGILLYAFLVTMLWSVGINGDNTLDAIVAPIFLQYLADNIEALNKGLPLPYITANGFFSTFVNVGGTGATLALALVLWNSRDPGYRQVSRLALPTQVFQINEPMFFGIPVVLNPVFMVPYVLNALLLTAGTYLLMDWGLIKRPFVNVPWTTPPILGHFLMTGGDWRAAVWGVVSLFLAMAVYWPFAKAAERQRLNAPDTTPVSGLAD